MWPGFKIPLSRHCEITKESQKYGQCPCKNVKKFIFSKIKFALQVY